MPEKAVKIQVGQNRSLQNSTVKNNAYNTFKRK